MRFVAGRGAGSEQERWHRARVLLRSKDAAVADRLVRGTAVADRLVRGAALAELLLAGNRRHRGLPAGAPWQSKGTAVAERHREDVAYCGTADAEPAGKGTAGTEDC